MDEIDIAMAILVAIIFWSGYSLGYMTGKGSQKSEVKMTKPNCKSEMIDSPMGFSYKPINPFIDYGLSKEDRRIIVAMRNTAYICGYRGGDVEYAVHQTLKKMGRYDLLPPCERK